MFTMKTFIAERVDDVNTKGQHDGMTTRAYHHGELREALLDAALASLDEHGELPSWRALARACQVSHTAPYRHFANFDALQSAVAAACFRRLTAAVKAASARARDPYQRLAAGLGAYLRFGLRHASWYELMFGRKCLLLRDPQVEAAGQEAYGTLLTAVANCGVGAPAAVALAVWSALHGLTDIAASGIAPPAAGARPQALGEDVIAMCVAHVRHHAEDGAARA